MAPPSESDILTSYLLQPAPLPSITTFGQFALLFPRALHNSSQLRSLYRDLQAQRNVVVDAVAASIQDEVKRGVATRKEVLRQKREAERDDMDGEVEMERAVSLFPYTLILFLFFAFAASRNMNLKLHCHTDERTAVWPRFWSKKSHTQPKLGNPRA